MPEESITKEKKKSSKKEKKKESSSDKEKKKAKKAIEKEKKKEKKALEKEKKKAKKALEKEKEKEKKKDSATKSKETNAEAADANKTSSKSKSKKSKKEKETSSKKTKESADSSATKSKSKSQKIASLNSSKQFNATDLDRIRRELLEKSWKASDDEEAGVGVNTKFSSSLLDINNSPKRKDRESRSNKQRSSSEARKNSSRSASRKPSKSRKHNSSNNTDYSSSEESDDDEKSFKLVMSDSEGENSDSSYSSVSRSDVDSSSDDESSVNSASSSGSDYSSASSTDSYNRSGRERRRRKSSKRSPKRSASPRKIQAKVSSPDTASSGKSKTLNAVVDVDPSPAANSSKSSDSKSKSGKSKINAEVEAPTVSSPVNFTTPLSPRSTQYSLRGSDLNENSYTSLGVSAASKLNSSSSSISTHMSNASNNCFDDGIRVSASPTKTNSEVLRASSASSTQDNNDGIRVSSSGIPLTPNNRSSPPVPAARVAASPYRGTSPFVPVSPQPVQQPLNRSNVAVGGYGPQHVTTPTANTSRPNGPVASPNNGTPPQNVYNGAFVAQQRQQPPLSSNLGQKQFVSNASTASPFSRGSTSPMTETNSTSGTSLSSDDSSQVDKATNRNAPLSRFASPSDRNTLNHMPYYPPPQQKHNSPHSVAQSGRHLPTNTNGGGDDKSVSSLNSNKSNKINKRTQFALDTKPDPSINSSRRKVQSSRRLSRNNSIYMRKSKRNLPKKRRPTDREILERKVLERAFHLPGYNWIQDWIQYHLGNHPVFGICCRHPLDPIGPFLRLFALVGSAIFGLAITNLIYILFVLEKSDFNYSYVKVSLDKNVTGNPTLSNDLTSIDITAGIIWLWTIGGALHSVFDHLIWEVASCSCFAPGGRFEKYPYCQKLGPLLMIVITLVVAAGGSLTVFIRATSDAGAGPNGTNTTNATIPDWNSMKADDDATYAVIKVQKTPEVYRFVLSYIVELALSFFFWYPIVGTFLFSGILGFGRLPLLGGRPAEIRMDRKEREEWDAEEEEEEEEMEDRSRRNKGDNLV